MSKFNKGQRQLHHTSASSIEIAEGYPNVKEGNEGDITLRHIKGQGVYIFVKFRNRWYSRQLFSGQGRNTGVKESNLENPSARQQLNFYDPKSRKTFPVDTSEVLTVTFGSPGKLRLGNKKSTNDSFRNDYSLSLGEDSITNKEGKLYLGSGDGKRGGVIFPAKNITTPCTQGLRVTNLASSGTAVRRLLSAKPITSISGDDSGIQLCTYDGDGGLLRLKSDSNTIPDGVSGMGQLYSGGSDKPWWGAGTGTAYEMLTSNTGLPLAGGTMTGSIYFTETSAASGDTAGLGQLWVKDDDPASLYYTNDDGEDIQITYNDHIAPTEQTRIQVRNDEGITIPAGSPLYSKGEIGGSERILVGIADASDANKMPCIGISYEEMNTSSTQDNYAVVSGVYNTNITVTSVSEQDTMYVAPHGGTAPYLTITRPTATNHLIQNVGICIRQTATNVAAGTLVSAIGRTNDVPNLLTNTLHADDDVKIEFGDADEYIKGDGSQLIISSSNQIDFNNSRLYDVNRITFNDSTSQTTAPVNKWSIQTGGYKTNNNSATTYYFQYRPNGESWANADSSIASIGIYDTYASMLVAPYDGKVTKISVHGYANDTGATDPFKFYVFKGTPLSGGGSMTLTQIGVTGTITPVALRQFVENTDITSSNTFSENDAIYVMYKKDSTTASQDLYFSVTVSGEYT